MARQMPQTWRGFCWVKDVGYSVYVNPQWLEEGLTITAIEDK